jgi:negative regulator of sigma E activity
MGVRLHAEDDPDPLSLLRPAFQKMEQSRGTFTRFTFHDLRHNLNFNEKGKKTADETQLYDVTYIGDLQYSRLLEVDGRPLEGRQLAKEQQRYDDAVRQHSALDDAARAKISHEVMKSLGATVSLSDLSSKYRSVTTGRSSADVCDCVVIDSNPLPDGPQRSYKFWVDSEKQEVMRIDFMLLADEEDTLKGSAFSFQYIYIDGIRLVSHSVIDATILLNKKRVHVVTEHTYSNFRKFSVTTTILPVESDRKQ